MNDIIIDINPKFVLAILEYAYQDHWRLYKNSYPVPTLELAEEAMKFATWKLARNVEEE